MLTGSSATMSLGLGTSARATLTAAARRRRTGGRLAADPVEAEADGAARVGGLPAWRRWSAILRFSAVRRR